MKNVHTLPRTINLTVVNGKKAQLDFARRTVCSSSQVLDMHEVAQLILACLFLWRGKIANKSVRLIFEFAFDLVSWGFLLSLDCWRFWP